MKLCPGCSEDVTGTHRNYCNFDCQILAAKNSGGKIVQPNGLPILCVKADGTMLEHGHGDHPDYKFPVKIEYVGFIDDHDFKEANNISGKVCSESDVLDYKSEIHALIYYDSYIAITLYECWYAMWSIKTGQLFGGSHWDANEYMLSNESREKIISLFNVKKNSI